MIKVDKIEVFNFECAIRGMRNPMNSWDKSDSMGSGTMINGEYSFIVGENDLGLMKRLYKAGTEHRTYARMIQISMDITAPLYWWKEMDRYTVGKSQISTSTMHKIHAKEFELDDFSHEHLFGDADDIDNSLGALAFIVDKLNEFRDEFIKTKDKDCWWQMIQLLPSSYNQKRTVIMSYETVFKIIKERTNHKLDEWNQFVVTLKSLPYIKEIISDESTDL